MNKDLFFKLIGEKRDLNISIDEEGWVDIGNDIACFETYPMSKYIELLEAKVLELELVNDNLVKLNSIMNNIIQVQP